MWERVDVATGLLPIDVSAPGLRDFPHAAAATDRDVDQRDRRARRGCIADDRLMADTDGAGDRAREFGAERQRAVQRTARAGPRRHRLRGHAQWRLALRARRNSGGGRTAGDRVHPHRLHPRQSQRGPRRRLGAADQRAAREPPRLRTARCRRGACWRACAAHLRASHRRRPPVVGLRRLQRAPACGELAPTPSIVIDRLNNGPARRCSIRATAPTRTGPRASA